MHFFSPSFSNAKIDFKFLLAKNIELELAIFERAKNDRPREDGTLLLGGHNIIINIIISIHSFQHHHQHHHQHQHQH